MNQFKISDLAITLVEPSDIQRRIIADHLRHMGVHRIDTAAAGAAALANIRQAPPDLVISAMYLPDMTGTDLVQSMRADAELELVPFMLISSETSFASLDPVRQAGVVAILPKPFDPRDLRRALRSTVEWLSPTEAGSGDVDMEELSVLVVDDSLTARRHIARVLEQLGIESITQAQNGREAVALIEDSFFDLVVTDYNMPEMDGEALIRYLREASSQRSIPILMVTSEESDSRLAAVQQAGVSGICDKPFDPFTVKEMVRRMLADD